MNQIVLIGRLVNDGLLNTEKKCYRNTIAVQRSCTDGEGKRPVDFFDFVIFKEKAETFNKYTKKGNSVALSGRMECNMANNKKYWNVIVLDYQFLSNEKAANIDEQKNNELINENDPSYLDDLPF